MKARTTSLHAKLYKFTFSNDLPHNLCPYFWKLVWSLVVLIPNFILQLPYLIINIFSKHKEKDCGDRIIGGIAIYFLVAIILLYTISSYQWFLAMFNCYYYNREFANVGWILNFSIVIGIIYYIIRKKIDESRSVEKNPNIITEFVKAKYNKYCPQIDWE